MADPVETVPWNPAPITDRWGNTWDSSAQQWRNPSGNYIDSWGNTWNPTTGRWYNPSGQEWRGTDPATGTGIFSEPTSYIDTHGNVAGDGSGSSGIDFGSLLGGGGGGSGPDHFFDINPLDQQIFDRKVSQENWQNEFDQAKFNFDKAQADRDYALASGDLDLAKQKQADANYWQGKSLELEQGNNVRDNQTRIATTQIDANSRIQAASIAAEADRYAAKTRLQEGLANAHNDAERNKILLAHEREMAQIARMEDETKRAIAAQENRIKAFDAESTRAYQQGDLALKNNQFILDASKSPRDLFGLYFMQRGQTPDWNQVASGGPLTQGDPLRVTNPLTAYRPTTTLPTDFSINNGQMGQVGSFAGGTQLSSNPFLNMGMDGVSGGGGGMSGGSSPGLMSGVQMPNFGNNIDFSGPPKWFSDINPGGLQGGVPLAGLKPGMNLSTVGSDTMGSDFTMPAYYDQGKTRAVNPGDTLSKGTQVWVDYPVPAMAGGGFTNARQFMTGDAPSPNPSDGGARPEVVLNPTGAPVKVIPNPMTMKEMGMKNHMMLDFGMPRYALGTNEIPFGNDQRNYPQFQPGFPNNGSKYYQKPGNPGYQNLNIGGMPIPRSTSGNRTGNRFGPGAPRQGGNVPNSVPGFHMNTNSDNGISNLDPLSMSNPFQRNGNSNSNGSPSFPGVTDPVMNGSPSFPGVTDPFVMTQDNPSFGSVPFNQNPVLYTEGSPGSGTSALGKSTPNLNALQNVNLGTPNFSDPVFMNNLLRNQWMPQGLQSQLDYGMQLGYPTVASTPNFPGMPPSPPPPTVSFQGDNRFTSNSGVPMVNVGGMNIPMPRYSTGTDPNYSAYQNSGMGQLYLQGSNNPGLDPNSLPPMMRGLYNYNMPLPRGLVNSVTGQRGTMPNTSLAFNMRGGGILPSLQTLGRQTQGETELLRGYTEGPVGIPWADAVDYMGMPTRNLQTAKRATGGFI